MFMALYVTENALQNLAVTRPCYEDGDKIHFHEFGYIKVQVLRENIVLINDKRNVYSSLNNFCKITLRHKYSNY